MDISTTNNENFVNIPEGVLDLAQQIETAMVDIRCHQFLLGCKEEERVQYVSLHTKTIEDILEPTQHIKDIITEIVRHQFFIMQEKEKCDELAKNLETQAKNFLEDAILQNSMDDENVRFVQKVLMEYEEWDVR